MPAKSISKSFGYTHDPYGRILTETRTIDSTAVLSFSYHYNGKGLVDRVTYPGGVTAIYSYDQYGNRTWMAVNGTQLWHLTDYTGRTTQAQVGSSLTTYSVLDDNGLMASVGVRRNQNLLHGMTFTHDGVTGNLMERTGMFSYGEEFAYDDLDRLTSYTAQNGTKDITYAGNGNILSHTDRGTFTYNSSKPHAVETVGSVTHPVLSQAMGCSFTYNGFGKATHLHDGMLLSAINNYDLDITYGPDRERWKYSGKELDSFLGLHCYDYGFRWYDPIVCRWTTPDPMREKYYDISAYVYCMGNPLKLIDLFGLAPGDFFRTVNAAAIDFGLFYNDNSIREGREYGSSIYVVYNRKGEKGYSYSIPNVGKKDVVTVSNPPMGHIPIAVIHTHGRYQDDYHNNDFSGLRDSHDRFFDINYRRHVNGSHDIGNSNNLNIISYLVTPNGSLQKYDPSSSKITVISNDMPSDVEDPNRLNKVNSIVETNPIGSSDYLRIWRNIITDNYE